MPLAAWSQRDPLPNLSPSNDVHIEQATDVALLAHLNNLSFAEIYRRWNDGHRLTFTACLGPCAVGNNALLQIFGRSIWFKDLNGDQFIPAIFDYIEAMLGVGHVLPPPADLVEHIYERYLPSPDGETIALGAGAEDDGAGLERLDPVCLMDVDPAIARWSSAYNGRTYYFCAPSCKKAFEREPTAYV